MLNPLPVSPPQPPPNPIMMFHGGIYEIPCEPQTWLVGEFIRALTIDDSVVKDLMDAGKYMEGMLALQKATKTEDPKEAVGVVMLSYPTPVDRIQVRLLENTTLVVRVPEEIQPTSMAPYTKHQLTGYEEVNPDAVVGDSEPDYD